MPRLLTIVLVSLLYFIAYYQDHTTSELWARDTKSITGYGADRPLPDDTPYYSEHFVNDGSPGTISHVSSITQVDENSIMCTWYAGSREGAQDVAIYSSTFKGKKWSGPTLLVDRKKSSSELNRYVKKIGNSLIYNDNNGRLWLFYSSVAVGGWSFTSLNYKVSPDNGHSWSRSRKIYLSPFFNLTNNVKNKGISFNDGSFIVPVYHEFINNFSQVLHIVPDSTAINYRINRITRTRNAIQPSLVHTGDSRIIAFFRNFSRESKRTILMASSTDLGRSWSDLSDTVLPNPNSGFDMIRLHDGGILGVINNSYEDRGNLELVISYDTGRTWKTIKIFENTKNKKYAYPSIILSTNGLYHITYTYEKKRIKHIVFNGSWLRSAINNER